MFAARSFLGLCGTILLLLAAEPARAAGLPAQVAPPGQVLAPAEAGFRWTVHGSSVIFDYDLSDYEAIYRLYGLTGDEEGCGRLYAPDRPFLRSYYRPVDPAGERNHIPRFAW